MSQYYSKVREEDDEKLSWDFSIATGCIMTLILGYLVQIVSLKFKSLETRNRLTMTIWWSHFLNMITLELKQTVLVSIWLGS